MKQKPSSAPRSDKPSLVKPIQNGNLVLALVTPDDQQLHSCEDVEQDQVQQEEDKRRHKVGRQNDTGPNCHCNVRRPADGTEGFDAIYPRALAFMML